MPRPHYDTLRGRFVQGPTRNIGGYDQFVKSASPMRAPQRFRNPGASQMNATAKASKTYVTRVHTQLTGTPASPRRIIQGSANLLCHSVPTASLISLACAATRIRLCAQDALATTHRATRGSAWPTWRASSANAGTTGTRYRNPVLGWSHEYWFAPQNSTNSTK